MFTHLEVFNPKVKLWTVKGEKSQSSIKAGKTYACLNMTMTFQWSLFLANKRHTTLVNYSSTGPERWYSLNEQQERRHTQERGHRCERRHCYTLVLLSEVIMRKIMSKVCLVLRVHILYVRAGLHDNYIWRLIRDGWWRGTKIQKQITDRDSERKQMSNYHPGIHARADLICPVCSSIQN